MRIRSLLRQRKKLITESQWSCNDLPPRYCPIYIRTRPMRNGWKWRSARAESSEFTFTMTALCNPSRGNWQSMLIAHIDEGYSVVARYEYHDSHPGLHSHAHCERGGIETGSSGLDNLIRVPRAGSAHRRCTAWTESSFWLSSKKFYRIFDNTGPLFEK